MQVFLSLCIKHFFYEENFNLTGNQVKKDLSKFSRYGQIRKKTELGQIKSPF